MPSDISRVMALIALGRLSRMMPAAPSRRTIRSPSSGGSSLMDFSTPVTVSGLMVRDGALAPPHHEDQGFGRETGPHPEGPPKAVVSKDDRGKIACHDSFSHMRWPCPPPRRPSR